MTVTIDSPCRLSLRPSTKDKPSSFSLDILGGSLWFPASAVPAGLSPGNYKVAEVEVSFRTVSTSSRALACFVPLRIVSLK